MIDYHRILLSDEVRVQVFRQAIHEVVRPGDVVMDLGTGTGILAFFACQAGAARVYAIEREDIIQVAKEVAAANGYKERIIFIQGDATSVTVPEPVDIIMGDLIGVVGLEEHLLQIFGSVSRRCLKPDGRLVPEAIEIFFAPWEAPSFYETLDFWGQEHYGLSLQPCRSLAMNQFYSTRLDPTGKLAEARSLWSFSLPVVPVDPLSATACFEIERRGVLHGFAGWFQASLSPHVRLSTSPFAPPTVWRQAFFPLEKPISVQSGDRALLTITVTRSGDSMLWGWAGNVVRGKEELASFSAHMFLGLILPVSSMRVMSKGCLPPRSEKGEILLEILSAMEGEASLKELAERLWNRFPHRFGTLEAAFQYILSAARQWGHLD